MLARSSQWPPDNRPDAQHSDKRQRRLLALLARPAVVRAVPRPGSPSRKREARYAGLPHAGLWRLRFFTSPARE
jgi:hypothetical protein